MKKIVRLTESDLTRIVRRVINEGQEMQQQLIQKKAGSCFDMKKYPTVNKLMGDYNIDIYDLADMFLRIINPPYNLFRGVMGASSLFNTIKTAYNKNAILQKEATLFLKCMGVV